MLTLLVVLVIVAGCSYGQETAAGCGVRNYDIYGTMRTSEYGPNEASFGEFPWHASLLYQNHTSFCAATLVSPKHVVTAAQCVYNVRPREVRVRFGQWHINNPIQGPRYDIDVSRIFMYTRFNPNDIYNDIAVLQLSQPVKYHCHINSVCLPQSNFIQPNSKCVAIGYSYDGQNSPILKKFELPYLDPQTCQNRLRRRILLRNFLLDQSFVCAGEDEEHKNACFTEAGGPLVCKDEFTSRYILIGVGSLSIGCNTKDLPLVYTNVPLFSKFINDVISGHY